MELILIVGFLIYASDLWVGGRITGIKGLLPEKIAVKLIGLIPQPKAALRPTAVVAHRSQRTKKGYFYVNTTR